MDPIPWYRSPVYISTLVQILSLTVVGLGMQTLFPLEMISGAVQAIFVILGLGAGFVAEWKRRRSDIQPLMSSAAAVQEHIDTTPPPAPLPVSSARAASNFAGTPAVLLFSLFAVSSMFTGCATQRVAETVEQRAGALLGDFNIFQQAAIHIGEDQTVPAETRATVVNAAIGLKPAVDQLDGLLRSYITIKGELAAATGTDATNATEARLQLASTKLSAWITDLAPKIAALRTTLEGALR